MGALKECNLSPHPTPTDYCTRERMKRTSQKTAQFLHHSRQLAEAPLEKLTWLRQWTAPHH